MKHPPIATILLAAKFAPDQQRFRATTVTLP
jgi:hypothetical protein